ncbi:MAG: tRNA (5-methylaminomethyl-2-thiouridine)(34)-methyltransferase MnmD [Pseudomonadota bacterium]
MSSPAQITWNDGGVPVSTRFDDPYYSLADGLAETQHVFLAGNDLPARFRPGFHIAELGFGTGLNFCAALRAWRAAGMDGPLHFTTFEAFPMAPEDQAKALAAFPIIAAEAEGLRTGNPPDAVLTIVEGDVRDTLPAWSGQADAWFLDGFSPAKNPEMWSDTLLAEVGTHTAPQGTAATYTAAGHVRRGLEAAGFAVTRTAGFGRKRHMTRAAR